MTTSRIRNTLLVFRNDLFPCLISYVEAPEVIKFFRILIFASKNIHLSVINCCRVPTSWTRKSVTAAHSNIYPVVSLYVKNCNFISSCTLTKPPKHHHLSMIFVDNCCVLVTLGHLVPPCFYL